jgi:hypothetical protein
MKREMEEYEKRTASQIEFLNGKLANVEGNLKRREREIKKERKKEIHLFFLFLSFLSRIIGSKFECFVGN